MRPSADVNAKAKLGRSCYLITTNTTFCKTFQDISLPTYPTFLNTYVNMIALLTLLLPMASAIKILGYLGTTCSGENLYNSDPGSGCFDISTFSGEQQSIIISEVASNQALYLYSDNECKNLVDETTSDECYIQPQETPINSVMGYTSP